MPDDEAEQDRDFLERGSSPWPASVLPSAPAAPRPKGPRRAWFGDPRRPRTLAIPAILSIAAFPIAWFVFLILASLGGSSSANESEGLDKAHFVVIIAAVVPVVGLVATFTDWLPGWRSYPRDERARHGSAAWALAAVLVAAAMSVLAFVLWTTPL